MSYNPTYQHPRAADLIADDKYFLVSAKKEFIEALESAIRQTGKSQSIIDSLICAEEYFEEAISSEWERLCEEDGVHDDLPRSTHMKAWIAQQRKNGRPI